ncbi:PHP domain-containing protein [Micrococcus sp. KRD096]|uniref:PHP domain-containing protein n=1 Tax=Micrococcus sp. KRD096 TaxID=2729721 RepID=UPI0019D30FF7|nr:PHP domain-containing protein [Micrococcus sp. KRD096]
MSRAAAAGRTAAPFAHLHVASAFSAHYGVSWPEDLVAAAAAADMDLLACTDRDGLYGMAKHVGACLRHGITPIVGVDLAVRWSEDEDAGRVVVLARGGCHGSGYRSLCELVSAAHARTTGGAAGGSPWASVAELAAAAAGRVPTAANRDNPPETDLGWGVPRVPEAAIIGIDGPPEHVLRERTRTGLLARYPHLHTGGGLPGTSQAARDLQDRAEHELGIITRLGFSSYFLTVAAVVDLIEGMGIRVAARGSGASSLVNHALRISHVDPMANGLIMERFLSTDRSTLPDIDIDVESARRHEIYHAVVERFGAERTTLMSMQNAYRARGAVRDAGLALGMPEPEVDAIAKQLWRFSASNFREALQRMPELGGLSRRIESGRAEGDRQLDLLVDLTERLDRLPRHISMHPCGVILGDAALLHRTPVQPSGMGLPMSQFDKHDMDPMGFLKLDILGVRMQSAIAYTIAEVERTTGEHIDLEQVPLDDAATYAMIRTTHTLGCFQIESPGQRELVGKLAPHEFNDLTVDISLFRPGPMQSDMVRPFLEQRHGWAPAHYPHPDLRPVLAETHGVTVFHEQVLRTMDVMTGCGLARADEHRRLLGGPQEHLVEEAFRTGALARGYSLDVIDEVWATLSAFGSFGFCKAHGAAFAVPTYHSAWLKTHHPAAFMAAILEHDPGMYPARLMVSTTRGTAPGRTAPRSRSARPRQVEGQLALDLPDTELTTLAPLFPDPAPAARVRTELELTALDVTAHLMDSHAPYLDALGVTRAKDLLGLRTQSRVLVAGVRVATQTPPMRSGKRVVFLSVDDGTGCVDASFFTEAQHASGEMLFSARLLLIEGTVRRTGDRAVSVQAVRAWDLHRPETLPDPDYLDATRQQWRDWLAADRRAAAARRSGRAGTGAQPLPDIPHHGTGGRPVKVRTDVGPAGGARPVRAAPDRPAPEHTPIPVPHPETWELLPTPDR